jgi:hypothetical protein
MAKVTGPLMSLTASGTVGKTLTFSNWNGRAYVRNHVIPNNPKSALQVGVRAMFGFLAAAWAAISANDKASYDEAANAQQISAFNEFMQNNMNLWKNNEAPSQNTADAKAHTGTTISAHTYTGGENHVDISLTLTTASNQWGVAIFRDTAEITAQSYSKCIAVIPVNGETSLTYVDSGLEAGTYHYRAVPFTDDGDLGTLLADGTAAVT